MKAGVKSSFLLKKTDNVDSGLKKKAEFIGIHVESVFESWEY